MNYWLVYAIVVGLLVFGGYFMFRTGFIGFIANAVVFILERWWIWLIIALVVVCVLEGFCGIPIFFG